MEKGEFLEAAQEIKPELSLEEKLSKVIKEKGADYICWHLDEFPEFSHKEIAMKLIEMGEGEYVPIYLDNFSGLDHREVVMKLIEARKAGWVFTSWVWTNQYKFKGLILDEEIATKLIETGQSKFLAKNLKSFIDLSNKVAMQLVELGQGWYVLNNKEKFSGLVLNKEIAMKLIETGLVDYVNIYDFDGVDEEVAIKLIELGKGQYVLNNKEKFSGLVLNEEIAMKLIETGQSESVYKHLQCFKNLNSEVATKLIESGEIWAVANNLEEFSGLNKDSVMKLIENGYFDYVVKFFYRFSVELDKEIAKKLIEKGKVDYVANHLKSFRGLDKEVAIKLIDVGKGELVAKYLQNFRGLDNKDIDDIFFFLLLNYKNILIENLKIIKNTFGLENICKKFKEKYPDDPIRDSLYLHFGEKTDWQEKLGEKPVNEFLDFLPKSKERDEKRNAFTHNEYDRTSEFLQYLNKYELFNVNDIDFEITTEFVKKYGLAKNTLLYEYFRNLQLFNKGKLDNLPPEQVYEDEITSLEILEKKYKTLQQKVFSSQEITAEYLKTLSHFEITLLSQITGKNTHRFDTGRPPFDQIIQDFIAYSEKATEKSGEQGNLSQDDDYSEYDDYDNNNYDDDDYYQEDSYNYSRGEYAPTPEEYKSFKLQANKVEYEFDKSNLEKPDSSYNILKKDVLKIFSTETADKDKFLSLKKSVIEKIQAKLKELENKTDNQYIAQQREKLMLIISNLEKLDFKEIKEKGEIKSKSYDELLLQLLDLDKSMIERSGLQDELRQIVFRKMLDQSYGTVDRVERIRTSMQGELNALGILHLLDLIDNFAKDHILNTEKDNKEKYWTDEAWQKIKESNKLDSKFTMRLVFNKQYKELKEVADKMKALDSGKGNFKIQCCPDRGFIGEMSGYLADVCYTAEYPLLARHPNLVPYKFIAEQDSDNKEFLGSVLVFELEDKDNNKVALLRAFDIPREHEVNVGEFIENFINKITPGLQARGVKKIIIPGNDGAISNYSLTISHMHKEYIFNSQNRTSLGKHFAFNGYDITDNCYVVRKI